MNSTVQTVALCRASHSMMVSKATHTLLYFPVIILFAGFYHLSGCDCTHGVKKKCKKIPWLANQVSFLGHSVLFIWVMISNSLCLVLPAHSDDSDSNQRPRSRSVQGSPQLSPMRSLGAEYDVETPASQRENHHNKAHSRLGSSCSHPFCPIL